MRQTATVKRRAVAVGAVVCVAALVVGGVWLFDGKSTTATRSGPFFSYTTPSAVVVMQGSTTVVSVPARFSRWNFEPSQWTLDGRYAFYLTINAINDPLAGQTLVAIDSQTGAVTRLPCPDCSTVIGDGGDEVLAYQADYQQVWSVTLGSGKTSRESSAALPKDVSVARFVVGAKGQAMLSMTNMAQSSATSNSDSFYLVTPDGTVKEVPTVGTVREASPIAAVGQSAIGNATIAMGDSVHGGACQQAGFVELLDSTNGVQTEVDVPEAYPPNYEPGSNGGLLVHDLWWNAAGYLYATIESWACNGGERQTTTPASLWRFDGAHWTKVDAGPLEMVRPLGVNTQLVLGLLPEFSNNNDPNGSPLYLEQGTTPTELAANAIYISTPGQASIP